MGEDIQDVETIRVGADHWMAERHLRERGWTHCGRGDWAIAMRSPSGRRAARISPFDPTAPFTADLYRSGRATGWFPQLFVERSLDGGGSLLLLDFLQPVDTATGATVLRRLRDRDPDIREAADLMDTIHRRATAALPWCGPIDDNPSNVMAALDGSLRILDPYYAAGPDLYGALLADPVCVARAIPPEQRRHMLQIPLAGSGGWDPVRRQQMQDGLRLADEALAAGTGTMME